MMLVRAISVTAMAALVAAPAGAQGWRSQYRVGDRVSFSVSGNDSDFQPCEVSDASDESLRVRCDEFRQWAAGTYIVYSKDNIRAARPVAPAPRPATPPAAAARPVAPPAAGNRPLKPAEYACYGAGGRPLAGMAFRLAANGVYTHAGGSGRVVTGGGQVRFVGGPLGGQVARRLAGNSFAFGQMECEPYE